MNTTFRAKPIPTSPDELSLSLICRWAGVQLEVGLGERIEASLWDAKSKNIHRRASGVEVSRTRLQMDEKSNEVSRQFQELVLALKRLPTSEEFRSYRKGHFDPVTGVKTPFEVYIQSFIDNFDRT